VIGLVKKVLNVEGEQSDQPSKYISGMVKTVILILRLIFFKF